MSVQKSKEHAWRAMALLLTSLSLFACSDDGESGPPATTRRAGNPGGATAAAGAGGSTGLGTGAMAPSAGHANIGGSAGSSAIGAHSGGSHDLTACPVVHKPVILFHGMSDGLIPVACGTETRQRWVAHNGCGTEVESVAVMGGHCEYSKGCPADGQVALCLFDGMDHGWAGGQGSYGFPSYESASELGWAFFEKYAW